MRYSVLHENEQLFASRYKLVLPSEDELRAELNRERAKLAEESRAMRTDPCARFVRQRSDTQVAEGWRNPDGHEQVMFDFATKKRTRDQCS